VKCPSCENAVLDIDVKCPHCGTPLGATGAHRMIGQTFLSTYELVDVLGQGGMSVVFKARHKMTDQEVALKILPPELAAHSQVKSRFLEEAKALAALDHHNIVHLYNFGQENGSFVLAMQFVQGKTWERVILQNQRLDWKASCRITIDVLKALEYAHGRGVIHRDMKPSNVLVREADGAATVMDFGIAKMTTSTKLTATGQTMGTVRYMSPEQVRGQEVDLRTDIYSLGATLYESLVGDTPFDGSTHFEIMTKHLTDVPKRPSSLGVEVPQLVEDALMRSLAKKAADRFESARDLRKILEAALREGDVGLVETQRLSRELLGEVKTTAPQTPSALGMAETARAATANDLADELEPGTHSPAIVRRRSRWPFVVMALAVVAGGATAAAVVVLGKDTAPAYRPASELKQFGLAEGKEFDDLQIFVETTTRLTPDQVAGAYRTTLVELSGFEPEVSARRDVVHLIAAVPRAKLCDRSIARASAEPCSPAHGGTSALDKQTRHVLLVADEPAELARNMRHAVARAVCDFQPFYADTQKDLDLAAVCAMTQRFAEK
jgi:serine/threonine protein kinase